MAQQQKQLSMDTSFNWFWMDINAESTRTYHSLYPFQIPSGNTSSTNVLTATGYEVDDENISNMDDISSVEFNSSFVVEDDIQDPVFNSVFEFI